MAFAVLRFNFASPGGVPRVQGELLAAALELAQFADSRGVAAVSVDEHHVTIELMRKPSDPNVALDELIGKCQEILGDDVAIEVRLSDRTDLKAKFRPVISKLTVHGEPRWTTPRG